jgi:hypothetical protein
VAAPTFISYTATSSLTTTTTPKTVTVAVQIGDVIVVLAGAEAADCDLGTPSDTVNTYTAAQTVDSANALDALARIWTATAATATTLTVSISRTGTAREWGFGVEVWRNAALGTSASNGPNGGTAGTPSQAITTTKPNSALSGVIADWNAADGTSRTWLSINGTAITEDTYARDSAAYATYAGRHPDAGAIGSKTWGLSAPGSQKYSIAVVEVYGTLSDLTVARFVQ